MQSTANAPSELASESTSSLISIKLSEKDEVISKLQTTLENRAPEALPLLHHLLQFIVISSITEAKGNLTHFKKLAHKKSAVDDF